MSGYFNLPEMYLNAVRKGGEETMLAICNCSIPSQAMLFAHSKLERKFDNIPTDEIEAMWEYVGSRFPEKTRDEKITCCKIIHCFGELL